MATLNLFDPHKLQPTFQTTSNDPTPGVVGGPASGPPTGPPIYGPVSMPGNPGGAGGMPAPPGSGGVGGWFNQNAGLLNFGANIIGSGLNAVGSGKQAKAAREQAKLQSTGTIYDPTNPVLKGLGQNQANFLTSLFASKPGGPMAAFQGLTSPLQQQASNRMGQFLNQASPEIQTQNQLVANPFIQQLAGGGGGIQLGKYEQNFNKLPQVGGVSNPFQQMATPQAQLSAMPGAQTQFSQLQNPTQGFQEMQAPQMQTPQLQFQQLQNPAQTFQTLQGQQLAAPQLQFQQLAGQGELQNPFASMGAVNPGQQVVDAAQTKFNQNLQRANTQLSQAAPSRFSSAFTQQGIDLNASALNDFNLFAAQALQEGQALQNQQQQQALNFMLGARGLSQDFALGARGLQQDAVNANMQAGQNAAAINNQFALGARGLQQDAASALQQFALGARGLQQDAVSQNVNAQQNAQALQNQFQLGARGLQQDAAAQLQQFMLGARGLQQSAVDAQLGRFLQGQGLGFEAQNAAQQNALQARGLQQNAHFTAGDLTQRGQMANQQTGLSAAQAMLQGALQNQQQINSAALGAQGALTDVFGANQGALNAQNQLAQQAWAQQFQQMLGAGNFGLAQSQQMMNPMLQLMLAGLQFGAPSDLNLATGTAHINRYNG